MKCIGFFSKCLNIKTTAICLEFNFHKVFSASIDMDIDVTQLFLPLSPQNTCTHSFFRYAFDTCQDNPSTFHLFSLSSSLDLWIHILLF